MAKYNKCILENLLQNFGTKGVVIQLDIAYVLIIQPNNASLIENFFSRTGNKGATIEYPIPLNIFIQINKIIDFFIFFEKINLNILIYLIIKNQFNYKYYDLNYK